MHFCCRSNCVGHKRSYILPSLLYYCISNLLKLPSKVLFIIFICICLPVRCQAGLCLRLICCLAINTGAMFVTRTGGIIKAASDLYLSPPDLRHLFCHLCQNQRSQFWQTFNAAFFMALCSLYVGCQKRKQYQK